MSRRRCLRFFGLRLLLAMFCSTLPAGQLLFAQIQVRHVKVLSSNGAVEIEVEASDRIIPQAQVLAGPDRLVIDFPDATPSGALHSQSVDLGPVKDMRVGLFQSKPPVTRIVLDLRTPQSFQVFPFGRTVMIKVGGGPRSADTDASAQGHSRPGLVTANYATSRESIRLEPLANPALEVNFRNGLLSISANKVNLSEVLSAIQQRTGAEISIPAGADQEKVVATFGPAPAQEVLAHLLNGARFNFLILNSASDPKKLARVILTPRGEGANIALPQIQTPEVTNDDESPTPPVVSPPVPAGIPATQPPPPGPQQDIPAPAVPEDETPDQ
jgi:hypothetical protein